MKPFEPPFQRPTGRRSLQEAPLEDRERFQGLEEEGISEEDLLDLFNAQAYTINRATALIREVEPIASKMSIPVDVYAVRVRDAVRRLRPDLDGTQIPFDLYKDMVDKLEKQSRQVEFEIVGDLTGDPLVDHYKIAKSIKSGGGGLSSWDEFVMAMEPWLLWFTLNQLIGQFQCQEHQECTAAKQPQGSEVLPIQNRMAISIAAMMLILGMQEEHILFALKQPRYDIKMPPADLINKARRQIESDGMHRELKEIVGATDPYLVIQYCHNYINKHPDGYQEWIAYEDLRNTRREVSVSYIYAHQYSPGHKELIDVSVNSVHRVPLNSTAGFNPLGVSRGTRVVDPESVSGISAYQYRAYSQQLSLSNRNISAIGGVLTSGFALDILCCFARFLAKDGDVSRLKRIRSLIAISQGVAVNGMLLDLPSMQSLMDWVYAQIRQEIMSRVQRAIDHRALDVTGWLYSMDPELLEDLAYCPFILDMIMMINDAVTQLRNRLYAVIREFLGELETQAMGTMHRWGTMYDIRRNNALLSIIDRVIEVAEICAKREESGEGEVPFPDPGEDESFYSGVPKPLKLPPEVVQKFFNSKEKILRPDGKAPIPPVGTTISSTQEIAVTRENYKQFCLGIVPDRVLDALFPEDR